MNYNSNKICTFKDILEQIRILTNKIDLINTRLDLLETSFAASGLPTVIPPIDDTTAPPSSVSEPLDDSTPVPPSSVPEPLDDTTVPPTTLVPEP